MFLLQYEDPSLKKFLRILLEIISIALILPVKEIKSTRREEDTPKQRLKSTLSWKIIAMFSTTALLEGLAQGIITPLFSLWFYLRFNIGISTIGYIFTASRVIEAFTYLIAPLISRRLGLVKSIVTVRVGGAVFMALIPLVLGQLQ